MELPSVAIIGAGPAGLTAAYLLAKNGAPVTVLEADPDYVGGISRTASYKGFHFDIGGHRFFSKSKEVEDFWTEILPNDMLAAAALLAHLLSRPVLLLPAQGRRGAVQARRLRVGPLRAVVPQGADCSRVQDPRSFEDWVTNQFGIAAVQHLLQDLHGEGLGHELQGDLAPTGPPSASRGCR